METSSNAHLPVISGTKADDWVYVFREGLAPLLPQLVPFFAIASAVGLGTMAISAPEGDEQRRESAMSLAQGLLAVGATALQIGRTSEAPRSRSHNALPTPVPPSSPQPLPIIRPPSRPIPPFGFAPPEYPTTEFS